MYLSFQAVRDFLEMGELTDAMSMAQTLVEHRTRIVTSLFTR